MIDSEKTPVFPGNTFRSRDSRWIWSAGSVPSALRYDRPTL